MKKGFTLIELLAVIVILAIIALIATPIVLNIIADTRESAKIRSAELYIDAIEQAIIKEKMNNTSFNPSSCTIANGVITCDGESIQVEVDGTVPSDGTITLNNGKVEYYDLKFDDKYVVYENGEHTLQDQIIKLGETYKLKNTDNLIVTAVSSNFDNYDLILSYYDAPKIYSYAILSDGSEWIYINKTGNKVKLLSKYNHFVSGNQIGEMDPSGALNPMAATSKINSIEECTCLGEEDMEGNCSGPKDCYKVPPYIYDEEYLRPFVNNTIKPKLVSSLGVNKNDIAVEVPLIPYDAGNSNGYEYSEGQTAFWIYDENCEFTDYGNPYCDVSDDATIKGVRVEITIDKSYVKGIVTEGAKKIVNNTYNWYALGSNGVGFSVIEKVKETNTENVYFVGTNAKLYNGDWMINQIFDLNTDEVIGTEKTLFEIADFLGIEYSTEEGAYPADLTILDALPDSIESWYIEGSGDLTMFMVTILKN